MPKKSVQKITETWKKEKTITKEVIESSPKSKPSEKKHCSERGDKNPKDEPNKSNSYRK
jgi:hypothetical protein